MLGRPMTDQAAAELTPAPTPRSSLTGESAADGSNSAHSTFRLQPTHTNLVLADNASSATETEEGGSSGALTAAIRASEGGPQAPVISEVCVKVRPCQSGRTANCIHMTLAIGARGLCLPSPPPPSQRTLTMLQQRGLAN